MINSEPEGACHEVLRVDGGTFSILVAATSFFSVCFSLARLAERVCHARAHFVNADKLEGLDS